MGMRLVLILMLLVNISTSQGLLAQRTGAHEVSVLSSAISISGETNVNKYSCELFIPTITDTLSVNSHHSALRIAFDSLILAYEVAGFDCGLEAMTHDFRGILKSEVYPQFYLDLRFDHTQQLPSAFNLDETLLIEVDETEWSSCTSCVWRSHAGRVQIKLPLHQGVAQVITW